MKSRFMALEPVGRLPPEPIECVLLHGIRLRIEQPCMPMRIVSLLDFLNDAIKYFKALREVNGSAIYEGNPYSIVVERGGSLLAKFELSEPLDARLPVTAWTEAVIDAYSNADTIEQISGNKTSYRKALRGKTGGWIAEVLKLLTSPEGEMRSFAFKMQHDRTGRR